MVNASSSLGSNTAQVVVEVGYQLPSLIGLNRISHWPTRKFNISVRDLYTLSPLVDAGFYYSLTWSCMTDCVQGCPNITSQGSEILQFDENTLQGGCDYKITHRIEKSSDIEMETSFVIAVFNILPEKK